MKGAASEGSGLSQLLAVVIVLIALWAMTGCGNGINSETEDAEYVDIKINLGVDCVAQVDGQYVLVTCDGETPVCFPLECPASAALAAPNQLASDMRMAMCIIETLEVNGFDW